MGNTIRPTTLTEEDFDATIVALAYGIEMTHKMELRTIKEIEDFLASDDKADFECWCPGSPLCVGKIRRRFALPVSKLVC